MKDEDDKAPGGKRPSGKTKPRKGALKKTPPPLPVSSYFANSLINEFRLTGTIVQTDRRKSGATVITLQVGSRPEIELTPERMEVDRFPIRIPPRLKGRWTDEILEGPASIITVTGRIRGVANLMPDGRRFITTELIAQEVYFLARWGSVFTHVDGRFRPVVEREGRHDRNVAEADADKRPDEPANNA